MSATREATKRKKQENQRDSAAWEEGDAGGQQWHKGTPRLAQRAARPMTRIEQYRLPRSSIRELMEGRPAGEDDGGIPSKGYLGRPPKLGYRTEDRAEAERQVRYSTGAGKTSGEHTGQESSSKRAGERQGRGGGGGREERDERRGTRGRGAHLAWPVTAKGHAPGGRRDRSRAQRGAVTR